MWWIWLLFVVSLVIIIYVSNKIGGVVDALDKKTKLSGAFLGAVLLAAVTSLPELVTSTTTAIMNEPDMTLGNILGTNLFDIVIIGIILVMFYNRIKHRSVCKSNVVFGAFTVIISAIILVCMIFDIKVVIPYVNINIITLMIFVLYLLALFLMRRFNDPQDDDTYTVGDVQNRYEALSVRKLVWLFTTLSIALVAVSMLVTFMAEYLADAYGINKGLAGAIFVGVPTSFPELVSCIALVRYGNFDAAYGNIVGSCLFNFVVIGVADIAYIAGTVFNSSTSNLIMSVCLMAEATLLLVLGLVKGKRTVLGSSAVFLVSVGVLMIAVYIIWLALTAFL